MAGLPDAPANRPSRGALRLVRAEANPGLQFLDERGIVHLRRVPGHHVFQDLLHGCALAQQHHAHTVAGPGPFQQAKFVGRDRLAVVVATGALSFRDGVKQRGCRRLRPVQPYGDGACVGRVEPGVGLETVGECGKRQVLGGATERDVEMVIVRIDDGAAPRQIWCDHDAPILQAKGPALRVVARWRQRGVSHQFTHQTGAIAKLGRDGPTQSVSGVLLAGARRTGRQQRCQGAAGGSAQYNLSAHQHGGLR